jgi:hypothetical protein
VPNCSSPKLRGPRSRHCAPAAPTLPTDINGLPPWAPLPPPAVLVVANCAFCQKDQPSTVPCPVKINDLQHEHIGKIERDITAFEVAPQLSEHTAEDAVLVLENLLKPAVSIRDLALQQEAALAELEDKIAACERSGRDAQDVIARRWRSSIPSMRFAPPSRNRSACVRSSPKVTRYPPALSKRGTA